VPPSGLPKVPITAVFTGKNTAQHSNLPRARTRIYFHKVDKIRKSDRQLFDIENIYLSTRAFG
jgi:hypothetical protein